MRILSNAAVSHVSDPNNIEEGCGKTSFFAIGGVIGAALSASCCILPLVLFSVGVSGAWISHLTALSPYQPIFVTASAILLGMGYWKVYRDPRTSCDTGEHSDSNSSTTVIKIALGIATILILSAVAFPYVAPLILE